MSRVAGHRRARLAGSLSAICLPRTAARALPGCASHRLSRSARFAPLGCGLQGGEGCRLPSAIYAALRFHAPGARTLRPCRIVQALGEQPQRALPASWGREPDAVSRLAGKELLELFRHLQGWRKRSGFRRAQGGVQRSGARVVRLVSVADAAEAGAACQNRSKKCPYRPRPVASRKTRTPATSARACCS
jgi:hypothetical protein